MYANYKSQNNKTSYNIKEVNIHNDKEEKILYIGVRRNESESGQAKLFCITVEGLDLKFVVNGTKYEVDSLFTEKE